MARRLPLALGPVPDSARTLGVSTTPSYERRYRVTLMTPQYGGGVATGRNHCVRPIRETSIRYGLVFWWRLLRLCRQPKRDFETLFHDEERPLWGAMADQDDAYPARVYLRVSEPAVIHGHSKELALPSKSLRYAVNYALFPQKNDQSPDPLDGHHHRSHDELLMPNTSFTLSVTVHGELSDDMARSLDDATRCWASFSGIGARTRRGLGSLQITTTDNEPLAPISASWAKTHLDCGLVAGPEYDNGVLAWAHALRCLQEFRQPGHRIAWPDTGWMTALHRKSGRYPRWGDAARLEKAAMGLPIVYQLKKPDATYTLTGPNEGRRASPVIVKALWCGGHRYVPMMLRLPSWRQTTMGKLVLTPGMERPIPLDQKNWRGRGQSQWQEDDERQHDRQFVLDHYGQDDAVDAFVAHWNRKWPSSDE